MGPRGAVRRSASEGVIPSQDDSTPREAARVPGRRARTVYGAALAAVSLCAAFLPLADHLGYEFAELIALFAGLFGAVPGIAGARAELWRPSADALRAVLRGLLSGGVRRPRALVRSGAQMPRVRGPPRRLRLRRHRHLFASCGAPLPCEHRAPRSRARLRPRGRCGDPPLSPREAPQRARAPRPRRG